jgi:protein gp37
MSNWNKPVKWNKNAEKAGVRQRVFCSSLADVFDNSVPEFWREDLFKLIRATPHLDWLLLTKRIGNVESMVQQSGGWPVNAHLGITVVNQEEADRDIPKAAYTKAKLGIKVLFLSMEPLLGRVNLGFPSGASMSTTFPDDFASRTESQRDAWIQGEARAVYIARSSIAVNWVIVGGESGTHARPMHPDWPRDLRDQCSKVGVPFFFKQWGEWAPHQTRPGGDEGGDLRSGYVRYLEGDGREPDGHFRKGDAAVARIGVKASGNLLCGDEWAQLPDFETTDTGKETA